jgi:putative OPT family oligopeptide transporter
VQPLSAPQANLVKSVAEGMFSGHLPWGMIVIGIVVGAGIIALDLYLKSRGSRWSTPVLAVAVGIYLPLDVSLPILAGGVIAEFADRWHARHNPGKDAEKLKQNGMLFAAGLITGEALIGIYIAVRIWLRNDPDVLALKFVLSYAQWAGAALLLALCYLMYRVATPRRA